MVIMENIGAWNQGFMLKILDWRNPDQYYACSRKFLLIVRI
jgi:hypothetical protein